MSGVVSLSVANRGEREKREGEIETAYYLSHVPALEPCHKAGLDRAPHPVHVDT